MKKKKSLIAAYNSFGYKNDDVKEIIKITIKKERIFKTFWVYFTLKSNINNPKRNNAKIKLISIDETKEGNIIRLDIATL